MSDDLYSERARVVIGLARAAKALGHQVGFALDPKEPEWPVLFIDLPTGQVSWHLTRSHRAQLAAEIGEYEGDWDGHTTDEKYDRLDRWRPRRPRRSSKRSSR